MFTLMASHNTHPNIVSGFVQILKFEFTPLLLRINVIHIKYILKGLFEYLYSYSPFSITTKFIT